MTFDVVGTLIDFETGIKDCLAEIAAEAGVAIAGERRHAQKGYGSTIEPTEFTEPDYHFTTMAGLADAVARN
nr:hypothetical protein [Sinorhizobium sp. 7-81]